jgi:hypothetical protein
MINLKARHAPQLPAYNKEEDSCGNNIIMKQEKLQRLIEWRFMQTTAAGAANYFYGVNYRKRLLFPVENERFHIKNRTHSRHLL